MAATPAPASEFPAEGPVLSVISKRVRSLRKKLNRITQMEDSLSQGKSLNKEQLDTLRSKPSVLSLIDELEKLRSPLSSALAYELSSTATAAKSTTTAASNDVQDLVKLMYFGSLFDVKPQGDFTSLMLTRTHERGCCLTYDYVTDDATDLLNEADLDLISDLQGLLVSRPVDSSLSHREALQKCVEHAELWLANSDRPFDSASSVSYAALREKLNKIMASDYFTATPEMKGPGEVAAAAAVGSFGSFEVPTHEDANVVPVEVPVQGEGSVEQYQETVEDGTNYEEYETGEEQSGAVPEVQKDDLEPENPPEVVSIQTDQEQLQADGEDHGHENADFREQQFIHRRGRGGRGGRRGYPNGRGGRGSGGRGGGPYQNGRGQYYDNYYPRNNYYNRRGGRGGGGGGGGNSYYNHSSAAQGNYNQANVGVVS